MEFADILQRRRTIRLFQQKKVEKDKVTAILDAARLSSCAMNKQVLRYAAVSEKSMLKRIFDGTLWAAMVRPHRTPEWGKTAPDWFIVIHGPQESEASYVKFDVGAAIMSYDKNADVIIAVGSGVIGDIGKIVSRVSGKPLITVATAPPSKRELSTTTLPLVA